MPLTWSTVIPDGWSQHHYPVTEGAMTAECLITRKGEGDSVFDPETGSMTPPPPPVTIYEGICRVQQLSEGSDVVAGDQGIIVAPVLVVVPWNVDPIRVGEYGDLIQITKCPDDKQLLTRKLFVAGMLASSLRWERDLFCQDNITRSSRGGVS